MKGLKKYLVTIVSTDGTYVVAVPASSKKSAADYMDGNGEVVSVSDVTKTFPISAEKVGEALEAAGFGQIEMDLITRTLQITRIAE